MEYYILQFILFLLIFARISAVLVSAPVFSYSVIPVQVKISIAVFFALALFPLLKDQLPKMNLDFLSFTIAVLIEVSVGLLIGFATSLIFYGMQLAGELIGFDIGLNVASAFDPEIGSSAVTGQMMYYLAMLIFLVLNGHHFIIDSIKISYESIPISGLVMNENFYKKLIEISASMFVVAVKIAAPVIVAMFLTNVALGILSRIVPQMNIFMVGFPLKIGLGLFVFMSIVPFIVYVFKKLLMTFEFSIVELIRYM
jgi:flagellar biosynthesis protein FliR